ncbi:MAG: hypothetical protein ACE5HL_02060 [Terriglobia bacterium]
MTRTAALRVAHALVLLGWCLPAVPALASEAAQATFRSEHSRRQWRKWGYEKVKNDCERLMTLVQDLRKAALGHEEGLVAPAVQKRIQALEKQARELRAAVAAVDENVLSLSVIRRAEEIKVGARSLRKRFDEGPREKRRKKLRDLVRKIEKRADSVADHMRSP